MALLPAAPRVARGRAQQGRRVLQHGETLAHSILRARTVARGQEHDDVREAAADGVGELEAVHAAGHQYVGEHENDVAFALDEIEAGLGAGGLFDRVAELFEIGFADLGDFRIVFDQQHGAGVFLRGHGGGRLLRQRRRFPGPRQEQRHDGAAPRRAGDGRRAAGLMGEAVDLAQAQAGALADVLGGEERLEHPRQHVGRNARTGVGDADGDEVARKAFFARFAAQHDRLRGDGERAARRHGVAGIDGEIEQRELELARIDLHGARPPRHADLDLDIAAQRAAEHVLDLGQPFGEIDDARLQRLPPRECQQLPRQAFAALRRGGDRVEQVDLLVVLDVAAQPLHAAADDHQKIVEVGGDAAGQSADGLELLGLVQRAFRHFAALGFVVQALGAAQREPQHGEQQQRRRQAEDQMGANSTR